MLTTSPFKSVAVINSQFKRLITSSTKSQSIVTNTTSFTKKMAPVPLFLNPTEDSIFQNDYAFNQIPKETENDFRMKLIGSTIYRKIQSIDLGTCEPDALDPFFVCDLKQLDGLLDLWNSHLPRVEPFYAVKCNNNSRVLSKMIQMGLGFDCASKNEIKMMLELGASPSKIIYANPCKAIPYIRYANTNQVNLTTVDNIDELYKMKQFHPDSGILIRIQTDDSTSTCPLSVKFGADLDYSIELIAKCKELGLNLKGLAFHVGSGCKDFRTIELAVKDSKKLFNIAETKFGFKFDTLDIGGGFDKLTFTKTAQVMRTQLDVEFPQDEYPHLKMISELGRFLSSSLFTLVANVTSKRAGEFKERLYLNDGLYGNLNCILFDHQVVEPKVLTSNGDFKFFETYGGDKYYGTDKEYSIWGPSCDGLDCISARCKLTHEVSIGDWIYFQNIGAYTSVASTNFNGFETSEVECLYVE